MGESIRGDPGVCEEFRHLTDYLAIVGCSWVVRFGYGLLGLALAPVLAFWVVGLGASRYQVDPGPIEGGRSSTPLAGFTSFEEDTPTSWPDARIWEG